MKLIERYIFTKIAGAAVMIFVALGTMVWLSQALRQFDLVTANGQTIWTFFYVSLLLVPALVSIVLPVALLIAVIYGMVTLNSDSELVVINASGAGQMTVVKPVIAVGLIVSFLVAAMTLYFAPLSLRSWQVLLSSVRGDILTTILKPGQFMQPASGLTININGRNPDGTLRGIFVSDEREQNVGMTYLAERGAILQNPVGVFLIMSNGTIQQHNKIDDSISMIEFSSYAFDLSSFSTGSTAPQLRPPEQSTLYLFNPDPEDPYFRQFPGKYRSELHDRLSAPLYAVLFAALPLVFLGQAASSRRGRTAAVATAVIITTVLRAIGVFLPGMAETNGAIVWLMYGIPLGATLASIALVLSGNQIEPPERVVAFAETAFGRISGMLRGGNQPAARRG